MFCIQQAKGQESDNESPEHGSVQQLRQWISHYEEAVTNHYSPELRARIASIRVNGVHSDLKLGSLHGGSVKCRVDQVSPSLKVGLQNFIYLICDDYFLTQYYWRILY